MIAPPQRRSPMQIGTELPLAVVFFGLKGDRFFFFFCTILLMI